MSIILPPPFGASFAPISELEFCRRVGVSNAGAEIVYYEGFLAIDRSPETSRLSHAAQSELVRVAGRAFVLARNGYGHLLQRRLEPAVYSYFFVRSARPFRIEDLDVVLHLPRLPNAA